jgi:pimeloyl-ACP methyl ester carboxylesterase
MYRDNVAALAAWIPSAEQCTIAGASHGMNATHAAEFNRLIDAFVSSVAA